LGVSETNESSHLVDEKGQKHILEGEGDGRGGHRAGTGIPGKSEFPASWSDQKILEAVSDVATSPNSSHMPGPRGRTVSEGSIDGIDIRTVSEPGRIVTGYPTNTPRNPQ
jgi:hypothetical protein